MAIKQPLICPDCGAPMVLRETSVFKYKNGDNRKFYGCSNYPKCKATHGAHPNGESLGFPADQQTKRFRADCHAKIEMLLEAGIKKSVIYSVLAEELGCAESEVHFGNMNREQCTIALIALGKLDVNDEFN